MKIVRYRSASDENPRYGRVVDSEVEGLQDFDWADPSSAVQTGERTPLADVQVLAPIARPSKIICIGLNYRDHAAEAGLPVPTSPLVFTKHTTAVTGPESVIRIPDFVTQPDWEAELAIVIGREGSSIPRDKAREHILGFTCMNDVSARDIQSSESQWVRAKSFDTFAPLGPWIVTLDEFTDFNDLAIRCSINGEYVQDSRTAQMVFGVEDLVAFVSRNTTLLPGDVIATGTPPGVGVGMQPPRFFSDKDVVTVEIEGIGQLTNQVSRNGGAAS